MLTPALRRLLSVVLLLFGLLAVNSAYLLSVTIAGYLSGRNLENYGYLLMFLGHLGLGLLLIVPGLLFGALHMRRAWRRRNRYAVRLGIALYVTAIALLLSGVLLTRFGFFEVNDPAVRGTAYWLHVLTPLLLVWLFVLHRLAGPPLRWRRGAAWGVAMLAVVVMAVLLHLRPAAKTTLLQPFQPARLQTSTSDADSGVFIPAEHLSTDATCGECHQDIVAQSRHSMHRLSSFNNPAYRFSIEEAREVLQQRDGNVEVTQLCAACHDPVPLLSGQFSRSDYDPDQDPHSQDGITCMSCHAITAINGPQGNGDYTLTDPPRYPFAFSTNPVLKAINRQLIKAKPEFHKASLLKPVHQSAEFCSGCHKVALPFALNHYRWLRGQDHYDSFLLSGVSGHRVNSFYYPPKAVRNCAQCHMAPIPSDDPAARDLNGNGRLEVHNHLFPAANTGVSALLSKQANKDHADANRQRREMMQKAARLDLFAIKQGGTVDGDLSVPLRPELPTLQPGQRYLIETVIRTTGIGHALTQGTVDSNELWLDLTVSAGDRIIGHSGALDERGQVDPWAYFAGAYVLDKHGKRIERRNAQDIFTTLYNHQIPPGAAAVVHYLLEVPKDIATPITINVALNYRKFDSRFTAHVREHSQASQAGQADQQPLPITIMASDRVTLPVSGHPVATEQRSPIPLWQRWNDYGIALLREGNQGANKGELRAAAQAFARVEALGHADGAMNLARVYLKEGRIADTADALRRAATFDPPSPPWLLDWYSALVEREQGDLDTAIARFDALIAGYPEARARGFDFSRDYHMLNELGRTLFERARQERGAQHKQQRNALLQRAVQTFQQVLAADPENVTAHYNLALVYSDLGQAELASQQRQLHQRYRPDDHATERAATLHRQANPAANHAAEAVAIYALQTQHPAASISDEGGERSEPGVQKNRQLPSPLGRGAGGEGEDPALAPKFTTAAGRPSPLTPNPSPRGRGEPRGGATEMSHLHQTTTADYHN